MMKPKIPSAKNFPELESRLRAALPIVLAGLLVGGLAACSAASNKLKPYEEKPLEKVRHVDNSVRFEPKVDILFVIDDSGSMDDKQKNLSRNIGLFTNGLIGMQMIDYHIGVITTTMDNESDGRAHSGALVGDTPFVDRSTVDGMGVLRSNLIVGTKGSYEEKMFDPIHAALTPPMLTGRNRDFYRSDAHLAIIFITDSEDQSRYMSGDSLLKFLLGLKQQAQAKLMFYGVHIPSTDPSCHRSGEPLPKKLEAFFTKTNAKTFGLCDPDYGQKLAELGKDLVQRVGKIIPLARTPILQSILVTFGTQVIPNDPLNGWVYDPSRNVLILGDEIAWDQSQPLGTQLQVDFEAAEY